MTRADPGADPSRSRPPCRGDRLHATMASGAGDPIDTFEAHWADWDRQGRLVATAGGLAAAIPAAIFYNYYGSVVREFGARMEDFCLEFLNLSERNFEG